MSGKVPGPVIRERGAVLRVISRDLADRFRNAQRGTVRSGLTIQNGQAVVTDNYLKLKVSPGLSRNVRVLVRVLDENRGEILDYV